VLSNCWLTSFSWIEVGVIAIALVLVARKPKLWAQWPSCCLYVLVEFCRNIVLMVWLYPSSHHRASSLTYWISQGVLSLLRLWVIVDILKSFPGLDFIPRKLHLFVAVAGATIVLASVWYCHQAYITPMMQFKQTIVLINQAVSIGWAMFGIALLGSIKLFNLGWEPRGASVACCLFVRVCTDLLVARLYATHAPNARISGMFIDTFCSIALYVSWSCLLVRPPKYHDRVLEEMDAETMNGNLSNLLTAISLSRES
jgi:hypothetical protein